MKNKGEEEPKVGVSEAKEVVELEAEVASFQVRVLVAGIDVVVVAGLHRVMSVLQADVGTLDHIAELEVLVSERLEAQEVACMDLKSAVVEVPASVKMLLQHHRLGRLEILYPTSWLDEGIWIVEQTEMEEFEMLE